MSTKKIEKRLIRRKRIRGNLSGSSVRPRLSVFRSMKHIYAQVIDDEKGVTLVSASDFELKTDEKKATQKKLKKTENLEEKHSKKDKAFRVGELLATKAIAKKIKKVAFDRGGYKYHGRVGELSEGAKKGGLEF